MVTSRSEAVSAIIEQSLESSKITIQDIEKLTSKTSRRTIRRAAKDAEELGWIKKQARSSNSWIRGDKAREYGALYERRSYESGTSPTMYYVNNDSSKIPYFNGERVLISAGWAWQSSGKGFSTSLEDFEHLMIDSGGYQASVYFQDEYPYSPKQLHEFAEDCEADIVWGMDWACEDRETLASLTDSVDPEDIDVWEKRYERAFTDQIEQWKEHSSRGYTHKFCPVIQGQDTEHFIDFAKRVKQSTMPTDIIGIGTVCKRSNTDEILSVTKSVSNIFPDSKIHLFGATLNVWKDSRFEGLFHSSDTAAWIQSDPESGMYPESKERAYRTYKQKVEDTILYNRN